MTDDDLVDDLPEPETEAEQPAAAIQAPPSSVDSAPTVEGVRGIYERESYAWALDVFFVYENMGVSAKAAKVFTPARQALLKFAKQDTAHFMSQLLPKAMQLLEKANEKHGDMDTVVMEEKKGINDLKRVLVAAIAESGVQVG